MFIIMTIKLISVNFYIFYNTFYWDDLLCV